MSESTDKKTLLWNTVIRRDPSGSLFLMNKKEGGWGSRAIPIESEQWLKDNFLVKLGTWSSDEHGEYCPVTRVSRSEQPTLKAKGNS